jgi:membrane-associated protease RseP (regulator of RpoE activity)
MNSRVHKVALAVLGCTILFSSDASPAAAQNRLAYINPDDNSGLAPQPSLPKFGFSATNIQGYGERVVNVRWGSLAAQIGLEPGDIILSMNGYPLSYQGSWNDALSNAMASGGVVRLRIRDVRTGQIVQRQQYLGGGEGPVTPYYNYNYNSGGNANQFDSAAGPHTLNSTTVPQHSHPAPRLNKRIARWPHN